MKTKKLLLAALLALMLLLLAPSACADILYPGPASIEAGKELNHQIAFLESDLPISAVEGTLPSGLMLVSEQGADGVSVYLRGTPQLAGIYNAMLQIGEGSTICTLTVVPSAPVVTCTGHVRCRPNETAEIAVIASTGDAGSLSYQWYFTQFAQNESGYEMPGETRPSCSLVATVPGTSYYYCVVTNTNNGVSVSTVSDVIEVTVEGNTVTGVSLQKLPNRVNFALGEMLDTTGLQLSVSYSDGTVQTVTEGFTASPMLLNIVGTQTVQISYEGWSCYYDVSIQEQQDFLGGIEVITLPAKIRYTQGETLNTAGMTLRLYTGAGYQDVTEGFECNPTVLNVMGQQTITVTYGERFCTFTVSVEEPEHPVSIAVETMPGKTTYTVGESLDITGLVLRQISSRQNVQLVYSGFTCTPRQLNTVGRQTITVLYNGLSTSFAVTVTEAFAAAASPKPSPTPAPTPRPTAAPSPLPSTGPQPTEMPVVRSAYSAHQNDMGQSLIKVVVSAAVLALAVLGVYVFAMNHGGIEALGESLGRLIRRGGRHRK